MFVILKVLKGFIARDFIKEELTETCHENIAYYSDKHGWVSETRELVVDRDFELINSKLLYLMSDNADYSIFVDGLNPYIYQSDAFELYFNNCGGAKEIQYPVMNVVISAKNASGELVQDHFNFLKTEDGYRLIGISLRTGELD